MNNIPRELCEQNSYVETTKLLERATGKRRRLDDLTKFLKDKRERNKENLKYQGKLSFDVSKRVQSNAFFNFEL